ncbi:MAG: hypothetical protein K6F75_00630 [Butyrivibrio sp.]|nr:hypothetical protein [Butyrivibrio sp.]
MRKKSIVVTSVILASALMLTALGGCGKKDDADTDNGGATIFEPIGSGESEVEAQENQSTSGRADGEKFISIYDDKSNPENYLELTRSTESAEATADKISRCRHKDHRRNL